jgi:hypothetical protein
MIVEVRSGGLEAGNVSERTDPRPSKLEIDPDNEHRGQILPRNVDRSELTRETGLGNYDT